MRLRGRKGILEEIMSQPELVVLDPQAYKGQWQELFGNDHPIHVELGMGKGRFITQMSARYPHMNYIGVDRYDELIRRGAEKARDVVELLKSEEFADQQEAHDEVMSGAAALPNLRLVRADIEDLDEFFAPGEVQRFYLNFSDPWPKKKHARRRLTHPRLIAKYREVLDPVRGEIHMKTDSMTLFEYSLNVFSELGIPLRNISLDLHRDGLRHDLVFTEYEEKFVKRGEPIYRLEAWLGTDVVRENGESYL
jgi:tRNA (guanine-N7-)-methyltransferase